MTFTEEVETEIRELEDKATLLEEQIQYLGRTIDGPDHFAEPLRVNRLLSDSRFNDWRDTQNAIDHLRAFKKRLESRVEGMYHRIDFYEWELSR